MSRAVLKVSLVLICDMLGLPEGSQIVACWDNDHGTAEMLVEADWLPPSGEDEIDAVYTADYEAGTCRGRFSCGPVSVVGPAIPLPPTHGGGK